MQLQFKGLKVTPTKRGNDITFSQIHLADDKGKYKSTIKIDDNTILMLRSYLEQGQRPSLKISDDNQPGFF